MDEIRLPQHVMDRIDRRFTSRFAQMLEDRRRGTNVLAPPAEVPTLFPDRTCDDYLREP